MRVKVVTFLKGIIVPCVLLIFIVVAGEIMRPVAMDTYIKQIETFHDLPSDSQEVIVYGSSHAWLGVNTKEMYDKYGIEAYNYGCSWQHLNTTSLFFFDSLRTQSPKVALIETFIINDLLENIDSDAEIDYTRAISDFPYKREYLYQCFGNNYRRYLTYYFPFIEYHSNWGSIQKENFLENSCKEDFAFSRGYRLGDITLGVPVEPIEIYDYREFEQIKLNEKSIKILDQIVQTCREEDIEVIFFTTPYQGGYGYYEAMKNYAKEKGCTYINMFEVIDEIGIDCNTDFADYSHLNYYGATKVADYLAEYIIDNY